MVVALRFCDPLPTSHLYITGLFWLYKITQIIIFHTGRTVFANPMAEIKSDLTVVFQSSKLDFLHTRVTIRSPGRYFLRRLFTNFETWCSCHCFVILIC